MKTEKILSKVLEAFSNLNWYTLRLGWKKHSIEFSSRESFGDPNHSYIICKEVWVHRSGKRKSLTYTV